MSILDILLVILGIFIMLIGFVIYKKRTQIIESWRLKTLSQIALKDFEDGLYKEAYLQALQEEVPKAMKEKAVRDIQKKYNKTPLTEKFAKMATEAQKQASMKQKDPNYKSGFESIMDDVSVFSNQQRKGKNKK
tara:strand:- start:71 stop:472 length:402 start_codon:yes stop_codon:yes gene_type:complete